MRARSVVSTDLVWEFGFSIFGLSGRYLQCVSLAYSWLCARVVSSVRMPLLVSDADVSENALEGLPELNVEDGVDDGVDEAVEIAKPDEETHEDWVNATRRMLKRLQTYTNCVHDIHGKERQPAQQEHPCNEKSVSL